MSADTPVIFVIMNGEAGADDALRTTIGRLRSQHYTVEARMTWEGGHGAHFTREAISAGAHAVVACGGDGTLHEVVNAVMTVDDPPMVAGLPYGTGNDFLQGLGIDDSCGPEPLEAWLDESPTTIDLGRAGEHYFLNMASAGMGAEVTAEASQGFKDVAGSFAYFVNAIPAAFDIPTHECRIHCQDWEWEGELAFLFVGNGPQTGGGWNICPAARLDDGLLDVVIVPNMVLRDMARYGREMINAATPGDYGPIFYRQVEAVRADFQDSIPLNLDGEPTDGDAFDFRAIPEALRFIIPDRKS